MPITQKRCHRVAVHAVSDESLSTFTVLVFSTNTGVYMMNILSHIFHRRIIENVWIGFSVTDTFMSSALYFGGDA